MPYVTTRTAAAGVHAGEQEGLMGAALVEAVLPWHHAPAVHLGGGYKRVPLRCVTRHSLQCGLMMERDFRWDVHATGEAVPRERGGAVIGCRLRFRDLRLDAVGECHLTGVGRHGGGENGGTFTCGHVDFVDVFQKFVEGCNVHDLVRVTVVRLIYNSFCIVHFTFLEVR